MPEFQINTEYQSAQRFPAWIALTVFSAICVAATESQLPSPATAAHKWVLAVCCISLIFGFFSSLLYLTARHLFAATPFETGVTALLLAFWGTGLPVIMNPNYGIAVDAAAVQNANLYFSSWAALAALVFITASLATDVTGVSVKDVAPGSVFRWFALAATSVIVMASSSRYYTARDCSNQYLTHSENCRRTKFAISMGAISFVTSLVAAYLIQNGLGRTIEFGITIVLLVLWCFGVGFITFGQSPGAEIGNLYFSTSISFVLVVVLFADAFRAFVGSPAESEGGEGRESEDHNGEQTSATSPEVPAEEDI